MSAVRRERATRERGRKGYVQPRGALLARERGETTAELISAAELPAAQVQAIRAALTRAAGRAVALLSRVEPELIGGVVVRMGSRMYDASLKGKLDRLRVVMKGVG